MRAETLESANYRDAYEAAKRADDAYQAAAVAEHGPYIGRWGQHKNPATIAARAAKVRADTAMHEALKALHVRVLK